MLETGARSRLNQASGWSVSQAVTLGGTQASSSGQSFTGRAMSLYARLTVMPHGSGSPCRNAMASGSAAMYPVSAVITSAGVDSDTRLAQEMSSLFSEAGLVRISGLSSRNSGSRFIDFGFAARSGRWVRTVADMAVP